MTSRSWYRLFGHSHMASRNKNSFDDDAVEVYPKVKKEGYEQQRANTRPCLDHFTNSTSWRQEITTAFTTTPFLTPASRNNKRDKFGLRVRDNWNKRNVVLDVNISPRCAFQPQEKMCLNVSFMEMMTQNKKCLKSTPSHVTS